VSYVLGMKISHGREELISDLKSNLLCWGLLVAFQPLLERSPFAVPSHIVDSQTYSLTM